MIRAVLDTNVVVSALLFAGPTAKLVEAWRGGLFRWLVSAAILAEYAAVLAYPKFGLRPADVRRLLERYIAPYAEVVRVRRRPRVIVADPADDEFLACAVAGHATVIVSGDRHLLELRTYQGVEILGPSAFLTRVVPGH